MYVAYLTFAVDAIVAVGVVVFAFAQYRNGKAQGVSTEIATAGGTIDLLQKSVDVLRSELNSAKADLLKEHDEIIRLQESLKHKDEQIKQYLDILQNRNPEMDAFMRFMTKAATDAAESQKEMAKIMREMQEVLNRGTLLPITA